MLNLSDDRIDRHAKGSETKRRWVGRGNSSLRYSPSFREEAWVVQNTLCRCRPGLNLSPDRHDKDIDSKTGQIRSNIQGKRTIQCLRSVISADPDLSVDEVGVPEELADKLSYPEYVTQYNYTQCEDMLNDNQVLYILRGNRRFDTRFALYTQGFRLEQGDFVIRDGKNIDPSLCGRLRDFIFQPGDAVLRTELMESSSGLAEKKVKLIANVEGPKKKNFKLKIGDIVERKVRNGDIALFNRQPTKLMC